MQIKMKWLFECAPHWNKSAWTSVEDEALKVAGKKPYQNWDYIASRLETDRTAFMCFERFHFLNKRLNSKRYRFPKSWLKKVISDPGRHVKMKSCFR
jgi:hypothetical protein